MEQKLTGSASKTNLNLWSAFIGEAKANRTYTAYAMRAMEEGHPEVAQIFLEVAGSETIHAISHLKTLGEVKSTADNLRRVVDEEAYEMETMYPRMVREAEIEGRFDAVASFRLAMERERVHYNLFKDALARLESSVSVAPSPSPQYPYPPTPGAPAASEIRDRIRDLVAEVGSEKARIVNMERLREVIFGAQDGLISTTALVATVTAANAGNDIVIIAGLAGALGGTISMAAGSYLSSKAEAEVHQAELEREARELAMHPEEEMAELVEIYLREGMDHETATFMAQRMSENEQLWFRTMAEKELGISPEAAALENPLKDALVMGVSFLFAAAIPVLPYFLPLDPRTAMIVAIVATLGALFFMGFGKGRLVKKSPVMSGLEVVLIGSVAAIFGYLLGEFVPDLLGISIPQ